MSLTPEGRARIAEAQRRCWACPQHRARRIEAMKAWYDDPYNAMLARQRQAKRKDRPVWSDEELTELIAFYRPGMPSHELQRFCHRIGRNLGSVRNAITRYGLAER